MVQIDEKNKLNFSDQGSSDNFEDKKDANTSFNSAVSDCGQQPMSAATPSSDLLNSGLTIPPCNYLEITKDFLPIQGSWRVDTTLAIPAEVLAPIEDGHQRPNLLLSTQVGPIDAEVELIRGAGDGRALLKLVTTTGPITLKIWSSNKQSALIKCSANGGPVRLCIPRTFRGLVTIKERVGSTNNFSPGVVANCTTFYQRYGETKCFIGQLAGSGFGDEGSTWTGDEIFGESQVGGVSICYVDEALPRTGSDGEERFGFGWFPDGPSQGEPFGFHYPQVGGPWPPGFDVLDGMFGEARGRGGWGWDRGRGRGRGRGGIDLLNAVLGEVHGRGGWIWDRGGGGGRGRARGGIEFGFGWRGGLGNGPHHELHHNHGPPHVRGRGRGQRGGGLL